VIAEQTRAGIRQGAEPRVVAALSESEFAALREPWNALVERSASPSVFLRHEWFSAAWAWRKQSAQLLVLCAYSDDELSGILPLVIESTSDTGVALRRLEFLTVPDTQLCDLIAAPGQAVTLAQAFAAELAKRRGQWDLMYFDYLGEGALGGGALQQALGARGFRHEVRDAGKNLMIPLDSAWTDYYNTRSRSLKKANNLAANRLKKAGAIRVDWIEPGVGDAAGVERALATVIEVSRRSWKQDTGNSLDRPGPQAFIRTLTELARERGWLSVWTIYIDEQPLAMEYQLFFQGKVHALRADFDASCVEISPGSYLFRHLLEILCGRGLQRYYMGPGENAYKTRWSEEGDSMHRVWVYGKTLRGRLAWFNEAVAKPRLRALRGKFASTRESAAPPAEADQAVPAKSEAQSDS
jgi:CelD/BcsL family acetyltransferase involved in cellulose biosynthesis